ncbi:hypothetical protein L1987_46590 [Smallanthus sonchifolius]|uniref:Uncharacterized protein n=1 Tax=Smallanthus sonchifolius TaxID=185202 RepID=A0ACB9G160_9ASTR|nr:hypothetical protein L1987_46590 [Smallanthus sonchifolius]
MVVDFCSLRSSPKIDLSSTSNRLLCEIGFSNWVFLISKLVAIFLIQRNRHTLIGRAIDDHDMRRVFEFLKNDPVVDSVYDCKSEVIGPGFFRFKAEIGFHGTKGG